MRTWPISRRRFCAAGRKASRSSGAGANGGSGGGLATLAVGAYFIVFSTEKIVSTLGISKIIGGLFITAPVAALPEVFATWTLARRGQITAAATDVIGDMAATRTIAFIPLTIIATPIQDLRLFWVSLAFVAIMPAVYAAFIWWRRVRETGFRRWQVSQLPGRLHLVRGDRRFLGAAVRTERRSRIRRQSWHIRNQQR